MRRFAIGQILCVFVGVICVTNADAQTAAPPARAQRPPMHFEWVREGPANVCRDRCREWISASGVIGRTTLQDFKAFESSRDVRGATIVLDSTGGSVLQGLALGREFRRLNVTTTIGRTVKANAADGERTTLSPRASCNSMCVFLLIGGAKRHVPNEARVLVHQVWPSSKRDDADAATYTAANLISVQRVLGRIARYVSDMGVDIELFELSTRIPPWENLRALSRSDLVRLRVHTLDDPFPAKAGASPGPPPPSPTVASAPAGEKNTPGWALAERSGRPILLRKHPLTIEGNQIGVFEIAIACGEKPGIYRVAYQEKRRARQAAEDEQLRAVAIAVRKDRALLRAVLKVQSSARAASAPELISVAGGNIPTLFIDSLAAATESPLYVATTTTKNLRTTIRIGRAGLSENIQKLTSACPR